MRLLALAVALILPAPSQEPCKRSDFKSFDDFVNCQVAAAGANKPRPKKGAAPAESQALPPEPPPPDLPPLSARRQRDKEALEKSQYRNETAFVATLVPGVALSAGGLVALFIGLRMRDEIQDDSGPSCVVGKRCGDTCIEVSDTCHVGSGGFSGPLTDTGRKVVIAGSATLVAGLGFLVAGLVFRSRSEQLKFEIDRLRF